MTTDTARLLQRVAERAKSDPDAVLPALRVLAGEAPDGGRKRGGDPALMSVAQEINRARVLADRTAFIERSWSAERVAEHLGVQSRQAVAQRRARGTLLGATIGTKTYYPDWQFSVDGLADGLGRLLELLRENGLDDARVADDVLRMKHSELKGRRLLDAWRRGDWPTLELWLGDIGGWHR
jgi:hypothetical protein